MITERKPDVLPEDACLTISSSAERRQKLSDQISEYLARGGTIDEVPVGFTRYGDASPHQPKRIDGTVPKIKNRVGGSRVRFKVDQDEVIFFLKSGTRSKDITEHLMQTTGCSKPTAMAHIANARRKMKRGEA